MEVPSLLNWAYVPDPNGNITTLTDNLNSMRSQSFGYNSLDWLNHADGVYGTLDYQYDRVGNRLNESINGGLSNTYTYARSMTGGRGSTTNRLLEVSGDSPRRFGYDKNGNIASENQRSYVYSQPNRLTHVLERGAEIAEYVYNSEGQRTKKIANAETKIFHYDLMGHLIAETDENGVTLAEYIYLRDKVLAMVTQGGIYYYHNDHSETPQILTDETGRIVWQANYKPFGEAEILVEEVENPFRFPGQYYDQETGLHYNYFRDYHPSIGRYIQPDPIGLWGGINPYTYARNNPVNFVDPRGQSWLALLGHLLWELPIALVIEPTLDEMLGHGIADETEWIADRQREAERKWAEEMFKESGVREYLEVVRPLNERLEAIVQIYLDEYPGVQCPARKRYEEKIRDRK